jgi:tetratricopeptide (TPR) repeat protein/energy-coupling factor transporter ATP-binding protein EcfA2
VTEHVVSEKALRIFVSSPSDVAAERARVKVVADRLNGELEGRVGLEILRWEDAFYTAAHSFQEAIDAALANMSATDMVLCIVWKRAGLKLNPGIWHRADGSAYESGTVLEFETAVEVSRKHNGVPDVYLFRKTADVLLRADRASEEMEQYQLLQSVWKRWTETAEGYNTAGYQSFVDVDDFEQKLEACLRQWLERRGVVAKGPVWDRSLKGSPFRGLAAFEAIHAPVFFGRDAAISRATARLRTAPFLLLIGASGSGKSSLMRAGIVPRVTAPGVIAEVDAWRTAIFSPSTDPLRDFAEALFDEAALGPELRAGDFATASGLSEVFAAPGDAALAPVRRALARAAELRKEQLHYHALRPVRLLVAIDQLERLFIEADAGRVHLFAALLRKLVDNGIASVIGALRSDAYGRFQLIEPFLELLQSKGATLDVLAPSASELEEIVTRPVAACHPPLAYQTDPQGRSLAEVLVGDAKGGDALPLLQMTLQRLYEAQERRGDGILRFTDYPGMATAVARSTEDVLARLDARALAALPNLITAFVRDVSIGPDGGIEALTIVPVVRADFERSDAARKQLIDEFIAERLLTGEDASGFVRVRPVHEALLRVVPQAVAIIKENAGLIRVRHTLEPMVAEWSRAEPTVKEDHLATSPALIAGAAQLAERFGDELTADMRSFISASLAADAEWREAARRRQRRVLIATAAGLVGALCLAGLAGWQWHTANVQRQRAQTALNAASSTAETLVFDLARDFKNRPGMPLDLVNSILERVQGLQAQLAASGSTPDLRRLESVSLNELSDAYLSQGDHAKALAAVERSLAIIEALVAELPHVPLLRRDLAITLNQLGDVRRSEQNWEAALAAYGRALSIVESFVGKYPDDLRWQRDLWLAYNKIADVHAIAGPREEALATYRKSLAAIQGLVAKHPENLELRADEAFNYNRIAIVLAALGNNAQALEMYQNALAIHEQLAAAQADNTEAQRNVFLSYTRAAGALSALGRREEAIALLRRALAKMEQLAASDLPNAQWQRNLVNAYEQLAQLLTETAQPEAALEAHERALTSRAQLVAITPGNLQWQYDLGAAYLKVGSMLTAAGRHEDALAHYRRSVPIFQLLVAADPEKLERRRDLSISLLNVGDALAAEQKWEEARAAYEQCRVVREELAPKDSHNLLWQRDLAYVVERIGTTFAKQKQFAAALDQYRRALTTRERVRAAEAGNVTYARELALSHSLIAEALYGSGAKDEAKASYLTALGVVESYATPEPDNAVLQMDLVTALYRLAYCAEQQTETEGYHSRALAIVRRLDAEANLTPAQKRWADALEQWLASKPA